MKSTLGFLAAVFALLHVAGCASVLGADFDHPAADAAASSEAGAALGDGGVADGASTCVPPLLQCPDPSLPYAGYVSFTAVQSGDASTPYVGAYFSSNQAGPPFGTCTSPPIGGCCLIGGAGAAASSGGVSAGVVLVRNGDATVATLTATPKPDAGEVYGSTAAAGAWAAGDTLSVQAAGDTVAGFSGSIVVPAPLGNVTPALDPVREVRIPSNLPLVITWAPGARGDLVMFSFDRLFCTADDGAGQLTIAGELLTALRSLLKGGDAYVYLSRVGRRKVSCSNADVALFVFDERLRGLWSLQ
jgi:hypothetical protein